MPTPPRSSAVRTVSGIHVAEMASPTAHGRTTLPVRPGHSSLSSGSRVTLVIMVLCCYIGWAIGNVLTLALRRRHAAPTAAHDCQLVRRWGERPASKVCVPLTRGMGRNSCGQGGGEGADRRDVMRVWRAGRRAGRQAGRRAGRAGGRAGSQAGSNSAQHAQACSASHASTPAPTHPRPPTNRCTCRCNTCGAQQTVLSVD